MGIIYVSGEWKLEVERRCLYFIEKDETKNIGNSTLEPRVLALLVYFLENPNRIIDRDELIDKVWDGTNVSESAINWTVAQLRKSLGDNQSPRRYIQTLSKQGYQWRENVQIGSSDQKEITGTDPQTNKSKFNKFRLLASVGLVLIITAISYLILLSQKSIELPQPEFATPFTSLPGRESQPSFSPDGRWLVFVHQNRHSRRARLMLKATKEDAEFIAYDNDNKANVEPQPSTRLVPEIHLTGLADFIRSPSWAPHSKKLVYVQLDKGLCEIRLLTLTSSLQVSQDEAVMKCNNAGHSQTSWGIESNAFYFTDSKNNQPYQVYRFDLLTKAVTQIGPEENTQSGSHLVRVSPKKMNAIIVKDIESRLSEFYLMDLNTGEQQKLLTRKGTYYDIDWNADGSAFHFNQGAQRLYRYDLASNQVTLFLSGGNSGVYGIVESADRSLFAYVNSSINRSRIDSLKLTIAKDNSTIVTDSKVAFSIDSSHREWSPRFSKDSETIYFLSDRSGLPQIWSKENGAPALQLSNLSNYLQFGDFQISESGNELIGESDSKLHSISLVNENSWVHSHQEDKAANPIFVQGDKNIVFSKLIDNVWQLVMVPYNDKITEPIILTTQGGFFSHYVGNDTIYFSKKSDCGLWSLDLHSRDTTMLSSKLCISSNSLQLMDGVFYFEDSRANPKGIYGWNIKTGTTQLIFDRGENPGRGFSIDVIQNQLVVHRFNPEESDILMINNLQSR